MYLHTSDNAKDDLPGVPQVAEPAPSPVEGIPSATEDKHLEDTGRNPDWPNLKVGNPGNAGGGRLKKLTAEALAESGERGSQAFEYLRNEWLKKTKEHLEKGHEHEAERCQKRADNIQAGYVQYGVGSRVTITAGKPEWIELTGEGVAECFPGQTEAHDKFADWLTEKLEG